MSDRQMLIIKPRWFAQETLISQLRSLQYEQPQTRFTVLADIEPSGEEAEFIPMPGLRSAPKRLLWQTAQRLRRVRFDETLVLFDEARPESGYFEAKFWAFVAKAKARRLGKWKSLGFKEEATDKWQRLILRRFVIQLILTYRALSPLLRSRKETAARRQRHALRQKAQQSATPVTRCPVCQGELVGIQDAQAADFRRCSQCGSVTLAFLLESAALTEAFRSGYFQDVLCPEYLGYARGQSAQRLEAFVYLRLHDRLFGNQRGSYLDVGCASGWFLDIARQEGWKAVGVEWNDTLAQQARQRGHNVWNQDFLEWDGTERFSFLTMLDTLEHLRDPAAAFAQIYRRLAPGGVCLIRTPDPAKLLFNRYPSDDITRLWFPSAEALQRLSERSGLTVAQSETSLFDGEAWDVWLQRPSEQSEARRE